GPWEETPSRGRPLQGSGAQAAKRAGDARRSMRTAGGVTHLAHPCGKSHFVDQYVNSRSSRIRRGDPGPLAGMKPLAALLMLIVASCAGAVPVMASVRADAPPVPATSGAPPPGL